MNNGHAVHITALKWSRFSFSYKNTKNEMLNADVKKIPTYSYTGCSRSSKCRCSFYSEQLFAFEFSEIIMIRWVYLIKYNIYCLFCIFFKMVIISYLGNMTYKIK